mmetsp:Transcript_21128/g.55135  ORF Transcript_21128/g.55135 Transcript_21128/m.55135 type:complete len:725 (+) Transcript_21128:116-2290(+)
MRAPALVGALLSVSSALQAPLLKAPRAAPLQSTIDRAANREKTDAVGRYCADDKQPQRRATSTVKVGQVRIGSSDPIVLQTMGTTDTNDVQASVEQILRCKEAGADMVRLTVQGIGEAKNSLKIREQLDAQGVHIPLVADMHFNRKAAMIACEAYDKIRVNPGNFADGRKTFEEIDYDDPQQFEDERAYIEETFTPLVERCKELGRAIRIGTNHGSLSARIMSFYGDSAEGMVESALEFANICRKLDFHNFVFSMKASNPVVMVQAYRLLAATQYELGWDYPLHLGVTEAGEGEDGRMKSAIGIGALLADGLGDTIRVSLTEDPEFELEPCRTLAQLGDEAVSAESRQKAQNVIEFDDSQTRPITSFTRREVTLDESIYTDEFQALHRDGSVLTAVSASDLEDEQGLYQKLGMKTAVGMPFKDVASSDSIVLSEVPSDKTQLRTLSRLQTAGVGIVVPASVLRETPLEGAIALVDKDEATPECARAAALRLTGAETDAELKAASQRSDVAFAVVDIDVANLSRTHAARRVFHHLKANDCAYPAILRLGYDANSARAPNNGPLRKDLFILRMGMDGGSLSVDGLVDGFFVDAPFDVEFLRTASFGLLQGSRMRNVKTEFVSCPSCGRTLFDLQEVTAQISERTGHLPGVTIAIMGCIVNGPGEMADADFGYVGGAPGMVDLYVGKTVVRGGIPNEDACDALVELIKENDRWVEPSEVEEEELVEA